MLYRPTGYPGLRLRSLPRKYPSGVNLVTDGRADLLYIRIQNRGNQAIRFWHGRIPRGSEGQGEGFLPIDPSEWTAGEESDAESLVSDFGERVGTDVIWEPSVAHTGPVYSYVSGGTNRSHVVIGLMSDQEQGSGGWQERVDDDYL